MVGHVMHFALPCLAAREIITSGDIGRPVLGSSWLIKLWMEANRQPWHLSPQTGGGMLLTAGIHALDRLVWLMDGPVATVSAMAGTHFHDQEADDTALMLLRFADGRIGQVASVGYRDGGVGFAMDLVCEAGTLRLDFDQGVVIGRGGTWTPVPNSIEPDWAQRAVERRVAGDARPDRRHRAEPGGWALRPPPRRLHRGGPGSPNGPAVKSRWQPPLTRIPNSGSLCKISDSSCEMSRTMPRCRHVRSVLALHPSPGARRRAEGSLRLEAPAPGRDRMRAAAGCRVLGA